MEVWSDSEFTERLRKATADLPNMTKEEKLNNLREFAAQKAYRDYKKSERKLERKFKAPGKPPLEKKVVRLSYYRHAKVLFRRKLEEFPHIPDNLEWFRRFCKFRIVWLRSKGKRDAILKSAGLLERKSP